MPSVRFVFLRFALLNALMLAGVRQAPAAVAGGDSVGISEFMADNLSGVQDEDATHGDWIELTNRGAAAVDLTGWWLSDNASNKRKWMFPAVFIAPGGTLLVWADGKDRRVPGQPLHTNFSLAKNGEYLGLHGPDAATGLPVPVDEFAPVYPPQVSDVSCGRLYTGTVTTVLSAGAAGKFRVLPNNATGQAQYSGTDYAAGQTGTDAPGGWNVAAAFNDSTWISGATGIGYDTGGELLPLLGTSPSGNCQAALRNVNTSLLFRAVFNVPDASAPLTWKLRMKYDDGYVAFINGHRVDTRNFTGTLAWNSKADSSSSDETAETWTEASFPSSMLVSGANVLAVQGLNRSIDGSDFLLLPEIQSSTVPTPGPPVYFFPPTPNAPNGTNTEGPLLLEPTPADPVIPRPAGTASSPPMSVTVRSLVTRYNISAVRLYYRVMWAPESAAVTLLDNGVTPDATAGDGIFSGSVPTAGVGAGQMLRWRFEAQDTAGHITKLPAFNSATESPQYFGTVAANPATATSQLPVLEWFVENAPAKGPNTSAFRGSCYFLNRFYDNLSHGMHGDTTSGFPKKSYDFDFNPGFRFTWREGEITAKDINLLTNYADKTKARNTLTHEVGKMTGTPYHYCFPVRVQLNGGFHAVMDLMEDSDEHMLERNGLDPQGALYKFHSDLSSSTSGVIKKTRRDEDNADLQAVVDGLKPTLPLASRRAWAYDNLDLAATVNYMTTRQVNSDRDHGHKNFLLYRDTNRTREWQPIIWDVDLSQGHNFDGSREYFDDTLDWNNPLTAHASTNRLYNLILEAPEFQEMWVRRMRTLMDTIVQPPGTVGGLLETRMREIAASIDPDPAVSNWTDGDLDTARWGFPLGFAPNRPREEVERVVTGYFVPRRTFLFDQSSSRPLLKAPSLNNGIPLPNAPQSAGAGSVTVDSVDFHPEGATQAGEYIILRNTTANAIDITGWKLSGAVSHTFEPGTVIPSGPGTAAAGYKGLLHVVKNAA
ncbi:MAG TPA: CotH kinase family protein, partial [Verrucomicrobiales bacterium]|nr:CotH kinase family protein [Verrucomicrobiales bacterium]